VTVEAKEDRAMQLFQIKCRFSGAVRFAGQFGSLRLCVEAGVKAGADLAGANLAAANLAGAYLDGAYLDGAYLVGANLARADLAGAYLAGANLAGAYLAGANLAAANLSAAYLAGANLAAANLSAANLSAANLAGAYLAGANLAAANLSAAYLAGAIIRDGVALCTRGIAKEATRSDGYRFYLLDTQAEGRWRVMAGCRFFTLLEAWQHWGHGERAGTDLGAESEDILIMFEHHVERIAKKKAAP
jgi:hypothetical protein